MNYDQSITEVIDAIKADKSIVQPWRNKAAGRLLEAQAFVRMGKTTTYSMPPTRTHDGSAAFEGSQPLVMTAQDSDHHGYNVAKCNCPEGGLRRDCPVHGEGI